MGSGLSGIAAAVALVKRGFRPTILDAGVRADSEVLDLKARLASVEPDAWKVEDLAQLKRIGPAASTGIPQKLHFGSNFAYRDVDAATSARLHHASTCGPAAALWVQRSLLADLVTPDWISGFSLEAGV